jgi:hypothetical protein
MRCSMSLLVIGSPLTMAAMFCARAGAAEASAHATASGIKAPVKTIRRIESRIISIVPSSD